MIIHFVYLILDIVNRNHILIPPYTRVWSRPAFTLFLHSATLVSACAMAYFAFYRFPATYFPDIIHSWCMSAANKQVALYAWNVHALKITPTAFSENDGIVITCTYIVESSQKRNAWIRWRKKDFPLTRYTEHTTCEYIIGYGFNNLIFCKDTLWNCQGPRWMQKEYKADIILWAKRGTQGVYTVLWNRRIQCIIFSLE